MKLQLETQSWETGCGLPFLGTYKQDVFEWRLTGMHLSEDRAARVAEAPFSNMVWL